MTSLRLPITTILVAAALIALATIATSVPPAAAQTLFLRNATVIDGTDRPAAPQTDAWVLHQGTLQRPDAFLPERLRSR